MRTITQTYNVYTIDTHPNPERVFEWISSNWHDLADHSLEQAVDSLKAFADAMGLSVAWAISAAPDRGEHITFKSKADYDDLEETPPLSGVKPEWLEGHCPFTGTWVDEVIMDAFREHVEGASLEDVLKDVEFNVLKAIHADHDYLYSAEALREMCEANGYEFTEDGACH